VFGRYSVVPIDDTEGDRLEEDCSSDDDDLLAEELPPDREPMWVLPFFSLLPAYKQAKVGTPQCLTFFAR